MMKTVERISGLIGLLLLVAFFAPDIIKLPQIDITLILLGGVCLAGFDWYCSLRAEQGKPGERR
jgi:hypothetical protein